MAIYEYECKFCGKHLDEIQKMTDPPLVDCPACGQPGLHRLMSAPAFQLKGSGWYVTDFRGDKKDKPADTGSAKSTTESSAETSKAESTSTTTKKEDKAE